MTRSTGPLLGDTPELAELEARNALSQFDAVLDLILERKDGELRLSPRDICSLQGIAVRDIFACAGEYRTCEIGIFNSSHHPPAPEGIDKLVEEMCEYANSVSTEAFHVSAYLMWRLNWIHPFADGNGRTSRAVSYFALCCGLGMELPGTKTVPDLISEDKRTYYKALDAADAAFLDGRLDVSEMESLIKEYLEIQLKSAS